MAAGTHPEKVTVKPSSSVDRPSFAARLLARWHTTPLYLRIIGGVILGVIVGITLGANAEPLEIPAKLVLRVWERRRRP